MILAIAIASCSKEPPAPSSKPEQVPPEKETSRINEPGGAPVLEIVHTEFQSKDAKATSEFLTAMFGLGMSESPTPAGPLFSVAAADGTGVAVRNAADHEPGPGTTIYIETSDLEGTLARATQNGAVVMVPKMTFKGRGYIAWVEVPGGVRIAFLQHDSTVQTTGEIVDSPE